MKRILVTLFCLAAVITLIAANAIYLGRLDSDLNGNQKSITNLANVLSTSGSITTLYVVTINGPATNQFGGGGLAQTNIAVAGVTNAGTLAYSNATTFIQLIRTASNTWNGTFVGDGAGLTNIPLTGVNGLVAALTFLTNSIGAGGAFIEDNSGNGTNTTDWGDLTVKGALSTSLGSAGVTLEGRAFANASSGGADNFVAGSADNTLTASSDRNAVVGGAQNSVSTNSDNNAVIGGQLNSVGTGVNDRGQYSGVFAGYNNNVTQIGGTAQYSVIAGGLDGRVTADYSGVLAGRGNLILADYNVIAGGQGHVIDDGSYDAILGGYYNRMTNSGGYGNAIVGGNGNWAYAGLSSVLAGGSGNWLNNGRRSFMGGGQSNLIYHAEFCAILAGGFNQITNPYAGLISYSVVGGRRAVTTNSGAFVWADNQDADFATTGNNQFLVRASGGVGINTNNPGTNALKVVGNADSTVGFSVNGVPLNPGAATASDYTLFASTNQVVAVGSAETNLLSVTITANTLSNVYQTLDFTASGVAAINSGLAVYLGDVRLFTNNFTAAGYWMLRGQVMCGSLNAVWSDIYCSAQMDSTNGVMEFPLVIGLTTNNTLRIAANQAHNNITLYRARGRWVAGP